MYRQLVRARSHGRDLHVRSTAAREKAVVKGTIGGQRMWASFRRRNGCEIERWQRFSPWLLPPGGATR